MAGPGKVSWDSVEVWQKLVAAIIASGVKVRISQPFPLISTHASKANNSTKIDVSSVASHFGTTYDTIENRLRPVKKQAKEMKEAVSNGTQDKVVSTRKSPIKPKTPRKAATSFDGKIFLPSLQSLLCLQSLSCVAVAEGRITKSTPSKKTPKKDALKLEAMEHSFNSSMMDNDDFADSVHGGFGALDFEDGMADMLP